MLSTDDLPGLWAYHILAAVITLGIILYSARKMVIDQNRMDLKCEELLKQFQATAPAAEAADAQAAKKPSTPKSPQMFAHLNPFQSVERQRRKRPASGNCIGDAASTSRNVRCLSPEKKCSNLMHDNAATNETTPKTDL